MLLLRRYYSSIKSFDTIPGPKGLPLIGTTLDLLMAGGAPKLHRYVDKRHQQFGRIYRETMGSTDCIFIADPNEYQHIFNIEGKYPKHLLPEPWLIYNQLYGCSRGLFFMDDERWKYHRTIMNNFLLKGNLQWIENVCEFINKKTIKQLRINQEIDNLETILYKWSLDTIIGILVGIDYYKKNYEQFDNDVKYLSSIIHLIFKTSSELYLIPSAIASKLNIRRWRDFVGSVNQALMKSNELVEQLFIHHHHNGLLSKLQQTSVTDNDIKAIIIDLILAAGDTTAYAMEWILYLLAKHPDIQDELRERPDFAKNVLRETLRLYPVAPFLTRILPNTSIVCNYQLPKNSTVILSIYTTGRDEKYFKNAQIFNPHRWYFNDINNQDRSLMLKATLPFAIGARSCIGRKIAEIQLQTILIKIVNNYRIKLIDNNNDIEMILKLVSVPSRPIRLKFEPFV